MFLTRAAKKKMEALEAENHRLHEQIARLSDALVEARRPSAVVVPGEAEEVVGDSPDLPREIEIAIAARGFNPIGAGMTRSAVKNMLRVHREQDVLRMLDGMGEVIE